MSVTPSSAIVGVFRDQAIAEQAMDAFYNAGFTHEQVRKSVPETSNGFFEDLKNLFTGASTPNGNVASDLTGMGISDEEAQYYVQEHNNGNVILSVHASGREQEAQAIMHQYGAYRASAANAYSSQNTPPVQQQTSDSQQDAPTPGTSAQQNNFDSLSTQEPQGQQQPIGEQHPYQDAQQSVNPLLTPSADLTEQTTRPFPDNTGSDPYHPHAQVSTPEHDTQPTTTDYNIQNQTSQEATPEYSTDQQTESSSVVQDVQPVYSSSTQNAQQPFITDTSTEQPIGDAQDNQPTQPLTTNTTEPQVTNTQNVQDAQPLVDNNIESQPTQPSVTNTTDHNDVSQAPVTNAVMPETAATTLNSQSADNADELQQLQAQFAALQQQLQDVRAQLQVAKEREAQLKTARERQQQVETLRQQMQALQAELEATHAELQDTHSRLNQYQ